jgi:hypothetical protein
MEATYSYEISEENDASNFRAYPFAYHLLRAGFFLDIFFDPEDGGDILL